MCGCELWNAIRDALVHCGLRWAHKASAEGQLTITWGARTDTSQDIGCGQAIPDATHFMQTMWNGAEVARECEDQPSVQSMSSVMDMA
eukprot:m.235500 g.235500  ORF g.235500 m.235500 type:complete len:88 (+) comp19340_c1_seq1:1008-1271(+)